MFYQLIDLSHSMTEWGGDRNRSIKPIQKNRLDNMINEGQDLHRCIQIEKNSIKKVIRIFQKES